MLDNLLFLFKRPRSSRRDNRLLPPPFSSLLHRITNPNKRSFENANMSSFYTTPNGDYQCGLLGRVSTRLEQSDDGGEVDVHLYRAQPRSDEPQTAGEIFSKPYFSICASSVLTLCSQYWGPLSGLSDGPPRLCR